MAIAMLPFLFDRSYRIFGGNIASTLAGEFAFSISLSVAFLFLGVYARGLRTGRHRALAPALLALTALCHVVPAFFAIGGAVVLTLLAWDKRNVPFAATTFGVSGLIAAFWVVPFLARIAYTNDMGWEKITTYRETLIPHDGRWVVLMAIVGALLSLILRRRSGVFLVILAACSALAFVYSPQSRLWNARLLPFWTVTLYLLAGVAVGEIGRLAGRWAMVPAFAEPAEPPPVALPSDAGVLDADELGVDPDDDFLSPAKADEADDGDDPPRRGPVDPDVPGAAALTSVLALLIALFFVATPLHILPSWLQPVTSDRSFIPDWVRWNYTGYEGKPSYPEYRDVVRTMAAVGEQHGCGRAMWEYEPELDRLGTPMALMLLPHWTDGCIGSMEGLFFESSASTPYHFLNQSELSFKPSSAQRDLPYRSLFDPNARADTLGRGVRHLQLMGVRYFMAISPQVQEHARRNLDLDLLATSGPWPVQYNRPGEAPGSQERTWEIYRVKDSELVTSLPNEPVVMQGVAKGGDEWLQAATGWYQDESRWDVLLAASGPKGWARVKGADPTPPQTPVDPVRVANIRTTDDRISFDVDRPGTPVLVKASYFPNWQASGADGPWRVTPNLMVVVPTSTHVSLHYGNTPVDGLAWGLTLIGLGALVVLARRGRRDRRLPTE